MSKIANCTNQCHISYLLFKHNQCIKWYWGCHLILIFKCFYLSSSQFIQTWRGLIHLKWITQINGSRTFPPDKSPLDISPHVGDNPRYHKKYFCMGGNAGGGCQGEMSLSPDQHMPHHITQRNILTIITISWYTFTHSNNITHILAWVICAIPSLHNITQIKICSIWNYSDQDMRSPLAWYWVCTDVGHNEAFSTVILLLFQMGLLYLSTISSN